jgi:hypothetical protein
MTYYDTVNITSTIKESTFVPIKINIFKQVNLILLTDVREENNLDEYLRKSIPNIPYIKVNTKYLYYKENNGVLHNKDFYRDIKELNSKYTLEEFKDEEIISILFYHNTSNSDIQVYFNKDINQDIYSINLKDINLPLTLQKIILMKITNNQIKVKLKSTNYIIDLLTILHNKKFIFYKLFLETLDNLETFNKFVMNYESIKTFDMVKEKVAVTLI